MKELSLTVGANSYPCAGYYMSMLPFKETYLTIHLPRRLVDIVLDEIKSVTELSFSDGEKFPGKWEYDSLEREIGSSEATIVLHRGGDVTNG